MTTTNDITGDLIKSKTNNQNYSDGWDRIFKKRPQLQEDESESESKTELIEESKE